MCAGNWLTKLFSQLRKPQPVMGTRHDERHDPLISRLILPYLDHGAFQIRVPVQDRFDFLQFDTISSNLDLAIHTASIVQLPVGPPAHKIAGPIETCPLPRLKTGRG